MEPTSQKAHRDSLYSYSDAPQLLSYRGWLQMKTTGFIPRWRRRFFVLHNKKLSFYMNPDCQQLAGTINFDLVSVEVEIIKPSSSPVEFCIIPVGGNRSFMLKAGSTQELRVWAVNLHSHIQASAGKRTEMSAVTSQKLWWKHDRITVKQLLEVASTADLILFRGKQLSSKLTRLMTWSQYDHVAFVLRYSSGRLGLLEATEKNGVNIVDWNSFMENDWYELYDRVMYRHLEAERSAEMLCLLEGFLNEVESKKYGISARKFLQPAASAPGEEESYFCSELVAAAYRRLGLLPAEVSSAKYWPRDFSKEGHLPLQGEVSLGEELLIDFKVL